MGLRIVWLSMIAAPAILLTLPAGQDPGGRPEPHELDEVVVSATRRAQAEAFTEAVAAPARGRSLARWHDPICVGVANMQAEAARAMIDRIYDWAHSFGVAIGSSRCRTNVFVVATEDGAATARELVSARPREFRTGVSGADRGSAALRRFQQGDRPVRWWHVSLPVDEQTGDPIRRLPGQAPVEWTGRRLQKKSDFGVNQMTVMPSRLGTGARDDLQQVIIVIDSAALERATFQQLTDYVAMVALAQIDDEARAFAVPSILGLFDGGGDVGALSDWDRAFLAGLYGTWQTSADSRANLSAVAAAMARRLGADAQHSEVASGE